MQSKVVEFYLKKVNSVASFSQVQIIYSYTDEMEEDLIIEALNIALKNNKKNIRYIQTILDNWLNSGITTIEEYRKGVSQNARDKPIERSLKKGYGTKI
ncbi:DnaD domain-containing protein [[Clostridium] colinum]|uniref:DnaD domain-containing protein n=1 Tax=[Clostridium] colinum TaxID=36835 RepID=UPI002024A58E|nr:DnaD domain protein [[Clostridium] colinum]